MLDLSKSYLLESSADGDSWFACPVAEFDNADQGYRYNRVRIEGTNDTLPKEGWSDAKILAVVRGQPELDRTSMIRFEDDDEDGDRQIRHG